jgi:folate-binding protein YgfZ
MTASPGRQSAEALGSGTAARVVGRDVVTAVGPDARSYLQGQCSQDLDGLGVGESTESLVLSPQGKVDAYVRVTRTGDEFFVLDTDAGCGSELLARLQRFKLRVDADLEQVEWACLALRGPTAVAPADLGAAGGPVLAPSVAWPGWSGVDLLGPVPAGDPELESWLPEGTVRCDPEAWEVARIEAGVPLGGREVTGSTIAAEAGLVERTVSFTKGCFTGQELVARLDSRGSNVARHLWGVVVPGGARPPVGAAVWTADGSHEVGALSSVAWSEPSGATVALATLQRRVVPPEPVVVRWDGIEAAAEARPLPMTAAG